MFKKFATVLDVDEEVFTDRLVLDHDLLHYFEQRYVFLVLLALVVFRMDVLFFAVLIKSPIVLLLQHNLYHLQDPIGEVVVL